MSETKDLFTANPDVTRKLTALMQQYIDQGRSTAGAAQRNNFDLSLAGKAKVKGKRSKK